MRKLLLLCLLFGAVNSAWSQSPTAYPPPYTFATASAGGWIDLRGSGVQFHQLFWYPDSSGVTTCQVKLEYSNDGISAAGDVIANQTCTSAGGSTLSSSVFANYVRINPTTKTGAGTVRARYAGWISQSAVSFGGTFTANQGTAGMSNWPVNVAQITAAATGAQTAANSDSVTLSYQTLASGAVTTAMTGTTSTSVIAGTASNYIYITQCTTSNASTTVSTDILLQDGSGGTTLYVLPAPAAAVATTGGGEGSYTFPIPLKVPTSGNGLFAANLTTGSSTKISCSGFKSTISY